MTATHPPSCHPRRALLCIGARWLWIAGIAWTLVWTVAPVAQADWLVTRNGSRVETQGPWRVEGRRVIFTVPSGTLSVMRLSEVDMDQSRTATEEANRPAEEPAAAQPKAPRPEPVLVLTDKDIPKATSESEARAEEGTEDAGEEDHGSPSLRVIDWNLQPFEGGLIVIGRLENGTRRVQGGIRMQVELRNEDDEVLAKAAATLAKESLVAGGITVFRARFSGFRELPGEPHFVISGAGLGRRDDSAAGEVTDDGD